VAVLVGQIAIGCFTLAVPLFFAWLLWSKRKTLHTRKVFDQVGFLYHGYRKPLEDSLTKEQEEWSGEEKRINKAADPDEEYLDSWPTYWYESIVMARKAIIVMVATLVKDPYFAVMASVGTIVIFLAIHQMIRPFRQTKFNTLASVGLLAVCMTQITSIFYFSAERQLLMQRSIAAGVESTS